MCPQPPLFSIVTVCLNPGKDLPETVESVLAQDYRDFEYVIKDGLSQDGTQSLGCSDPRVIFVSRSDSCIYDAMNQALDLCKGDYVNFLNAGDTFRVRNVLSQVAHHLEEHEYPDVAYVDRYNEKLDVVTHYPPSLGRWYLFRKPVCHQALFVNRGALLRLGRFNTAFRIYGDYDVLLKLILTEKASHVHCPLVAVNYKDDGVSSAPRNRPQKLDELRRLRRIYFTKTQRIIYGAVWRSTLPGIRVRLIHQGQSRWLRKILCR